MRKLYSLVCRTFVIVSTLALGVACSEDETAPYKGNYFPITKGSRWTYEQKRACEWPKDETEICLENYTARTLNETLEWDEAYKHIDNGVADAQFVKVVGSEYFGTGYYITEHKFLDDALPVGGKWGTDYEEYWYDHYEIKEVNSIKKVKGKTYLNVIVVNQEYRYAYDRVFLIVKYYAKDIGLIYKKRTIAYADNSPDEVLEFSLTDYYISLN